MVPYNSIKYVYYILLLVYYIINKKINENKIKADTVT